MAQYAVFQDKPSMPDLKSRHFRGEIILSCIRPPFCYANLNNTKRCFFSPAMSHPMGTQEEIRKQVRTEMTS